MKIVKLNTNPVKYSSNVFLVLGSWNKLDDKNTLIDVGIDAFYLDQIAQTSTGVGKKPVEQVILTHQHFDHIGGLSLVVNKFFPTVFAINKNELITKTLFHDQLIQIGDAQFRVLHITEHSTDSVCLYNYEEGILFSGDTPIDIKSVGGTYSDDFINRLEELAKLDIRIIYRGHGDMITQYANEIVKQTLINVKNSRLA